MRTHPRPDSATSDSAVVAKAAIRAADRLGITNKVLARIIGVSEASVSRMRKGEFPLEATQKPFELAVLFIRLYRSLDWVEDVSDATADKLKSHILWFGPIGAIEVLLTLRNRVA